MPKWFSIEWTRPGEFPGILPDSFYGRDAVSVARDLVGCRLLSFCGCGVTGGTIAETEAYCGVLDRGCHAFNYRRTERTEPMYGPPGTAYVYMIYGLHHCLNVVCLREGRPHAVLIRVVIPEVGAGLMAARRGSGATGEDGRGLSDGPGKLCQALGIDRSLNGASFVCGPVILFEGNRGNAPLLARPRVGLGDVGEFSRIPWRFTLEG
ncbi:MAG: DNA-3-methyladenine glycosylase [Bacillota bacterium]